MKRYSCLFMLLLLGSVTGFAAEVSIGPQLGSGFAINPPNNAVLTVTGTPAEAVVNTVTVRIAGTAPFADYCTFQLRDSSGTIVYTFPTWYDVISFDHTVSGISDFAGRPVNQGWELWGQGSNTSGERVDQWWLTLYYDEPLPDPDPGVKIIGPANVELGDSVTLRAEITDITGPFTYQWSKDSTVILAATDSEYSIPAALYADAGVYTVTVGNGGMTTYESPLFDLYVWAEGSLPASSFSMLSGMVLLVIAAGVLHLCRCRDVSAIR